MFKGKKNPNKKLSLICKLINIFSVVLEKVKKKKKQLIFKRAPELNSNPSPMDSKL